MEAEIQRRLAQVFEPEQAALLADVIATASGTAALTGEVRTLTSSVTALVEAQARTEQRLEALVEAQARTEQRVGALAEAQLRTEERLGQLSQTVEALSRTVQRLVEGMDQAMTRLGRLDGRMLEMTYRERAGAYFGPLLRRMRVVAPHTLEDGLEARLTREEFLEVLRLDLLISGRPRRTALDGEVWLAVEVSTTVDQHDVARARRRASLLQKAGYLALPLVAGERLTAEAEGEARGQAVVVMLDGHVLHWDEAVATLQGAEPTPHDGDV